MSPLYINLLHAYCWLKCSALETVDIVLFVKVELMSFSHVKNNHVLLSVVTTIQPIIHGADEFWEYVSQNFRESRLISQL